MSSTKSKAGSDKSESHETVNGSNTKLSIEVCISLHFSFVVVLKRKMFTFFFLSVQLTGVRKSNEPARRGYC